MQEDVVPKPDGLADVSHKIRHSAPSVVGRGEMVALSPEPDCSG